MNIPYTFPGTKLPPGVENQYNDNQESKKQPFPLQIYGKSPGNSPAPSSFNLGTPSPPLTAISSRIIPNGHMMVPSPLAFPPQGVTGYQQPFAQVMQHQQQHQHQQQQNSQQYGQDQLSNYPSLQHHQQVFSQFQQPQQAQQPHSAQHHQSNQESFQSSLQQPSHSSSRQSPAPQQRSPHTSPFPTQPQVHTLQGPSGLQNHQSQPQQIRQQSLQQQYSQYQRMQYENQKHNDYPESQDRYYQGMNQINPLIRASGTTNATSNSDSPILQREATLVHPPVQDYTMNNGASRDEQKAQQDQLASAHLTTPSLGEQQQNTPSLETTTSGPGSDVSRSILTKIVSATDGDGSKKKRGRPKKLILDPETNQYIDSSHEHYKRLNRMLKESSNPPKATVSSESVGKIVSTGTNFDSLNDQTVKQLLEQKDRRGRPRKFPIEQTGVTIKGIRVNGTLKSRKKRSESASPEEGVQKKKRGRPRREQSSIS